MATSSIPVKMTAIAKIEKYPEGATKEQIEQGLVQPVEVVESVDHFEMPEEKVEELFTKK